MAIRRLLNRLVRWITSQLGTGRDPPEQPPGYTDTPDESPRGDTPADDEQDDSEAPANSDDPRPGSAGDENGTAGDSQPPNTTTPDAGDSGEWTRPDPSDEPPHVVEMRRSITGDPYPPYIGDPTDPLSPPFPDQPTDPTNTIEVRLYWEERWQQEACRKVVMYVEYCLLDAYAGQNYAVDVQVHESPIPDASSYAAFSDWYRGLEDMAKDANIAFHSMGSAWGMAGGRGGWINAEYFRDWTRKPTDPIKNVGADGDQDGPTFGLSVLLHEIGHCLGLRHMPTGANEVEAWNDEWVPPMDGGYEEDDATHYLFEYHPDVKTKPPKVQ